MVTSVSDRRHDRLRAERHTLVNIVGRPTVANWRECQASLGKFDVTCDRDERRVDNPLPRRTFRFQVQDPDAWALLEELNGSAIDQPFRWANCRSRAVGSVRCATAWAGRRDRNSGGRSLCTTRCATRSSKPAKNTACGWSARAPMARRLWIRGGCLVSMPERPCTRTANGCPPRAMKAWHHWGQLRFGQDRGLFLHTLGFGLRPDNSFRSRFRWTRSAGKNPGSPLSPEGVAGHRSG